MGVKKIYQFADVKAAIDMANHHYYRQFLRVRNDVSNNDFRRDKIKVERDSSNNPVDPLKWRGRGSDVGHAFRHLKATATAGKSTYEDDYEMIMVTREMLNSPKGQAMLETLDNLNPRGDEANMEVNRRLPVEITGSYYGYPAGGGAKQRIKHAVCELMKVGESTLWIHSTYPDRFHTS